MSQHFQMILGKYTGHDSAHVVVPADVYAIGEGAFCGHDEIESIEFAGPVVRIEAHAFEKCIRLTRISGAHKVEFIGDRAFSGCMSLVWEVLPLALNELGNNAFNGCVSLESVEFPETVARIGDEAFQGCRNLREAVLPFDVGQLGRDVFVGCSQLDRMVVDPALVCQYPDVFPRAITDACGIARPRDLGGQGDAPAGAGEAGPARGSAGGKRKVVLPKAGAEPFNPFA